MVHFELIFVSAVRCRGLRFFPHGSPIFPPLLKRLFLPQYLGTHNFMICMIYLICMKIILWSVWSYFWTLQCILMPVSPCFDMVGFWYLILLFVFCSSHLFSVPFFFLLPPLVLSFLVFGGFLGALSFISPFGLLAILVLFFIFCGCSSVYTVLL